MAFSRLTASLTDGLLFPALAAVSCLISVQVASAQDPDSSVETARRYDATSPTGVSYPNGSYSWSLPLVSIGEGAAPTGLSYTLNYNSGSNRSPNTAWSHGFSVRMSWTEVDDTCAGINGGCTAQQAAKNEWEWWRYNLVAGNASKAFGNYEKDRRVNTFDPVTTSTSTLEYDGIAKRFTFISEGGDIVTFDGVEPDTGKEAVGSSWTAPDGTIMELEFGRYITNRGLGLIIEPSVQVNGEYETKICAVNFASHYDDGTRTCPAGTQSATVRGSAASAKGFTKITSIDLPDGSTYNIEYEPNRPGSTFERVNCIKFPGQSNCNVTIAYDNCDGATSTQEPRDMFTFAVASDSQWNGSRDRVVRQDFADGRSIQYSYEPVTSSSSACRYNTKVTETVAPGIARIISTDGDAGSIKSVEDPLQNLWSATYTGANVTSNTIDIAEATKLESTISPEGQEVEHIYDSHGREIETKTWTPNRGSSISTLATYPSDPSYPFGCPIRAACNKPLTTTDANGNVTTYTYNATHGGIILQVGPAVNGVSPAVRTKYEQRSAWIKDGSGGFTQAGPPIWVVKFTKTCRTSNWIDDSTGCAGGNADMIRTDYIYGPDDGSEGNNLWLRGIKVSSDGEELVTCYQYDESGRKIAETKPEAGLTTCS